MKKFAVYPCAIRSKIDGQIHFISCRELVDLYKVDPSECVFVTDGVSEVELDMSTRLIPLVPRHNGDYSKFWDN